MRFWLFLSLLAVNAASAADSGAGTINDELRQELCLPSGQLQPVTVATSKDEGYTADVAARNADDILRLEAWHVGQQRLLFTVTFARKPVFADGGLILYLDLDADRQTGRQDAREHRGVDLMVTVSEGRLGGRHSGKRLGDAGGFVGVAGIKRAIRQGPDVLPGDAADVPADERHVEGNILRRSAWKSFVEEES